MFIPLLLIGTAALLWVAVVAQRVSLVAMAFGLILVGYACGYEAWRFDLGPGTLTLDRVMLLVVVAATVWRAWRGDVQATRPSGADWTLVVVLAWLTVSCLTNWNSTPLQGASPPGYRLTLGFFVPAMLYALVRHERFDRDKARLLLVGLASLGVYLALTAIAETLHAWQLVFPRYIADSTIGLHFGRARGPGLNSVSLGVYLGASTVAALLLVPRSTRPMQVVWACVAGLTTAATILTYTRSAWLGLALAATLVVTLQLPRRIRKPACVLALGSMLVMGLIAKNEIISLEREDSASVSAHSAQQRLAFAYVSYNMFMDHPLMGVGFGRFVDKKLPYLNDRSQSFELESLRYLDHHNTFLSLLTETGMLGLFAYTALLVFWGAAGWRLYNLETADPMVRALGLLLIGVLAVYVSSAVFHDLTLVHSDQWLLFLIGGSAMGALVNLRGVAPALERREGLPAAGRLRGAL